MRLILKNEVVDEECIKELAAITDSYSGSDLNELCKTACIYPIREMIDESRRNGMRLCDIRMDAPVRRMNVDNVNERLGADKGLQTGDDSRAGDGKGSVQLQ